MAWSTKLALDPNSDLPLYRQIADQVSSLIARGSVEPGERLPATRELAGQLGLNRATISAAYAALEELGLVEGHVGRGSFVARRAEPFPSKEESDPAWSALFARARPGEAYRSSASAAAVEPRINFASSRPDQVAFPLDTFRRLAKEVVDSNEASEILQLGSPHGYAPLRRFVLEEAIAEGVARSSDSVLMTNGC